MAELARIDRFKKSGKWYDTYLIELPEHLVIRQESLEEKTRSLAIYDIRNWMHGQIQDTEFYCVCLDERLGFPLMTPPSA